MKYHELESGERIPLIGQGTWGLGGGMQPDYSQDEKAVDVIRTAIELGYTHIDTAEMYGGGHTEELVGQAMQGLEREKLFITSKVWKVTQDHKDTLKALDGSLERLETDYLDMYLIHRPNQDVPLEETFKALNLAVEQGKVRHIGVSNFDLAQMKRAQALVETPLAANQVPYNLHDRKYVMNGVLKHCQENGILLVAYSPIDRGYLCEDPTVQEVAEKYNATPAQICLHWLIQQPMVAALPMSTKREHLVENLGALDLELSPEDTRTLDKHELSEDELWPM